MTVQHPSNAPVAWTGGTRPGKFLNISSSERAYRSAIFRKHVDIYVEFWGGETASRYIAHLLQLGAIRRARHRAIDCKIDRRTCRREAASVRQSKVLWTYG